MATSKANDPLAPVMRSMTQAFMGVFDTFVRLAVDILSEVVPAFQFLADAMAIYAQYAQEAWAGLRALVPLFMDVVKAFSPILGLKDTGGVLKQFRDALHLVVESMLRFTAQIAKAFGAIGVIDRMQANLRELANPKAGQPAAARDVQIKSFEDISRTIQTAAFNAPGVGGTEDKSEKEWLEKLANSLDDVKNNGPTLRQVLDEIKAEITNLPRNIVNSIKGVHILPDPPWVRH